MTMIFCLPLFFLCGVYDSGRSKIKQIVRKKAFEALGKINFEIIKKDLLDELEEEFQILTRINDTDHT
jgi:hypothetical protein